MNRTKVCRMILLGLLVLLRLVGGPAADNPGWGNDRYQVRLLWDASLEITAKGAGAHRFSPRFTVLYRADDPGLSVALAKEEAFRVPAWKSARNGEQTMGLFETAAATTVTATKAEQKDGSIRWTFPAQAGFRLEAAVELPPRQSEPTITFRFTPQRAGWYSIGYAGAPEIASADVDAIWQPLVWQERRFPRQSFLSMEHMCSLPAVLVSTQGVTVGVAADPSEVPFRLPTFSNAWFGALVRNARGQAQPLLFAPVLGLPDSEMRAGHTFVFRLRLVVRPGGWLEAFGDIAYHTYGFHDYRENAAGSLNETLENMIDFAMDDYYSGWVADLKAFDYTTDVPGTVKLVSALHPLSVAILTDREEIFRRRALPMIEYLMSRQKYLFSIQEDIKGQSASHLMRGPCAEVSELAALFSMSLGRSAVFRHYAQDLYDKPRVLNLDMVSEGASWQNALALYRMTGDRQYLERAKAGADRYIAERIDRPQTDFRDVHVERGGQFWTDFAPKWVDLLELYEETSDRRHLEAAAAGARLYATYVWMQPPVPDGEVVVNKGGKVGIYQRPKGVQNPQPMRAPEQKVSAWRVSQAGLTPEASTTYMGNPAVLLTHYAAYMLRLAHYTDDRFFRDIARSAVVGRYANFPGYDINGEYTTVYQRPDYPLRPWSELTYNNIYYNHVWPHIALLMDYLISDAFTRSEGKIRFPPRYAQGYAYLQSKVYGDRPGDFYEDHGVWLWMPRKLLRTDSVQINYVAGYGNGNFYLALLNQSNQPVRVKVTLNPDVIPVDVGRSYQVRVWQENRPDRPVALERGGVTVPVQGQGITALAIDGLTVTTQFQEKVFDPKARLLSDQSYATIESSFGKVTGMILSMGRSLTSGYIWLEATERELKEAHLRYKQAGEWKEMVDTRYPFEFSVPLEDGESGLVFWIEGLKPNGERARSATVELRQ